MRDGSVFVREKVRGERLNEDYLDVNNRRSRRDNARP